MECDGFGEGGVGIGLGWEKLEAWREMQRNSGQWEWSAVARLSGAREHACSADSSKELWTPPFLIFYSMHYVKANHLQFLHS
jgi:hypothetical protein